MGLSTGRQKGERKTQGQGDKYARNLDLDEYVSKIVEASDGKLTRAQVENSDPVKGYAKHVGRSDAELAAAYNNGVRDKGDDWEKGWLKAFGGK